MSEAAAHSWADAAHAALDEASSYDDGTAAQGTSAQVAIAMTLMAIYHRLGDIDTAIHLIG